MRELPVRLGVDSWQAVSLSGSRRQEVTHSGTLPVLVMTPDTGDGGAVTEVDHRDGEQQVPPHKQINRAKQQTALVKHE